MECYLVGGAVRDGLLGYPVIERDWVVVGQTPEKMIAAGFVPVGKDFPVFLHPTTHEEYALARTERKNGPGYKGFTCYAAPDVTLIQDLQRRDLTINAMAQAIDGTLIDPYGGQQDLAQRVLRHVSPAFEEDPVRILRVARFAARFAERGFTVASETVLLMETMVKKGEVDALVAERVWQETEKVLAGNSPAVFFEVLARCQALPILWRELKAPYYEQDLANAALLHKDKVIRFAILMHQLNEQAILAITKRYKIGRIYQSTATELVMHFKKYIAVEQLSAEEIVNTLEKLDAVRRKTDFERWLAASHVLAAISHTTGNLSTKELLWRQVYQAILAIDVAGLIKQGFNGAALREPIHRLRIEAVKKVIGSR